MLEVVACKAVAAVTGSTVASTVCAVDYLGVVDAGGATTWGVVAGGVVAFGSRSAAVVCEAGSAAVCDLACGPAARAGSGGVFFLCCSF